MKILYRYIDANGNVVEEHVGELGNWSIIPGLAVAVQVVDQATDRPESPEAPVIALRRFA